MMSQLTRWPDFLIIGAAKCGTTSLYHYLKAHPEVFLPDFKEPTFFAPEHARLVKTEREYLKLFACAGAVKAVGEASVSYLYHPESPGMIRDRLGTEVKLVAVLRNPVDMMYSAWAHRVRQGEETRGVQEALLDGFDVQYGDRPAYASAANYAVQLERFYEVFPNTNIRVLIFEEFFVSELPLFADLCKFIGVSDHYAPSGAVHNKGGLAPRSRLLQKFISQHYGRYLLPVAKTVFSPKVRKDVRMVLEKWNSNGKAGYIPPIDNRLRSDLKVKCADGVMRLENLLCKDLSRVWY